MKKYYLLFLITILGITKNNAQSEKNTNSENNLSFEKITSIDELNKYKTKLNSIEIKKKYYFQLYKLQECEKLKSYSKLKNLNNNELLKIVEMTYDLNESYEYIIATDFSEAQILLDSLQDSNSNSNYRIVSKFHEEDEKKQILKLDSLQNTNKEIFDEFLKDFCYEGFDVSLIDCKEDTEYNCGFKSKDERKINPNLLTFLNFRANSIGSIQHLLLLENGNVKDLDFYPNDKEKERINTAISSFFPNDNVYSEDYSHVSSLIKLKKNIYTISFQISGDGRVQTERFHDFGTLRYQIENLETIVPNTFEFYNNDTKKWVKL